MTKYRKLYQVRHYSDMGPATHSYSRGVGFKGRLLPRSVAVRIAKRLRRAGVDAVTAPVMCYLTVAQAADIDARYA